MDLMKPFLLASLLLCGLLRAASPMALDTTVLRNKPARLDLVITSDAGGRLAGLDSLIAELRASGAKPLLAEALLMRGDLLREQGRADLAIDQYSEALALAEKGALPDALIRSWVGLAGIHLDMEELDRATAELRAALAVAAPLEHPLLARIHLKTALVHQRLGRGDSARAAFALSERWARAQGDSLTLAAALHGLATLQAGHGELARAEELERKALAVLPVGAADDLRGRILVSLGRLLATGHRYDQALQTLEQGRQEAIDRHEGDVLRAYHEAMAALYRERGDTARTFAHLNMLMAVRDSLEDDFRKKVLADAEAQFGLSRMEKELALSRAEAEASGLRAQQARIAWSALLIIALLAAALLFSFYRRVKLKQQAAKALERDRERLSEENEVLHQENLMARFETLKSQIDPHFLFNAMNTLYTLVEAEPAKAREFIASFSALYRKVLSSRDRTIVPLGEELELVRHYLFLQRIRFGDSLRVRMEVPNGARGFLPPFTLQMLLENAIKHNVVSAARPLGIELLMKDDRILVRNDLRARGTSSAGTGAGLENIRRRYAMLGAPEPRFIMTASHYEASVPLLTHEP